MEDLLPFLDPLPLPGKIVKPFFQVADDAHQGLVAAGLDEAVVKEQVLFVKKVEIIVIDGLLHLAVQPSIFLIPAAPSCG